jgi:hypothetical protein
MDGAVLRTGDDGVERDQNASPAGSLGALVRLLRLLYLILLPYDWCCLRCWVDLKEESIYDAQVRICSIARPIIFLGAPPDLDMQPQQ